MRAGAGVLIAPSVAAAAAGWWSLAGLALALLLALGASAVAATAFSTVDTRGRVAGALRGLRAAGEVAFAALCGAVFGVYVVPSAPVLAAAVGLVLVTAAVVAGAEIPSSWQPWLLGALVLAAAAFAAVCLAIDPEPAWSAGVRADLGGVLLAAVAFFPLFAGSGAGNWRARGWLLAGGAVVATICVCALVQAGPARLGLSPAPLRTALAAADARSLGTLLAAVVTLATVPPAVRALGSARDRLAGERGALPVLLALGLAAVGLACLFGPASLLLVAGVVALAEVALAAGLVARDYRIRRAARRSV